MNIFLIHQYAGNKGDRAVAYAMCNLIKSIDSSINITISTSSPELWNNEPFYSKMVSSLFLTVGALVKLLHIVIGRL